jgi:hypothetical protein
MFIIASFPKGEKTGKPCKKTIKIGRRGLDRANAFDKIQLYKI